MIAIGNFLVAVLFSIGSLINGVPMYFVCGILWVVVGYCNLRRYRDAKDAEESGESDDFDWRNL